MNERKRHENRTISNRHDPSSFIWEICRTRIRISPWTDGLQGRGGGLRPGGLPQGLAGTGHRPARPRGTVRRAGALHPLARCPRVERPALPVRTEVEPPGPPGRQPGGLVLPAGLSGPPPGPSPLRLPGAGHGAPDPGDDVLGRGDRVTPGGRGRDFH